MVILLEIWRNNLRFSQQLRGFLLGQLGESLVQVLEKFRGNLRGSWELFDRNFSQIWNEADTILDIERNLRKIWRKFATKFSVVA